MKKRYLKQAPQAQIKQPPITQPILDIAADIGDFLLDREVQHVSPRTLEWHRRALDKFHSYCNAAGINITRDVDAHLLRSYLKHLGQQGHNAGGISNLYRSAKAFLRWCADEYSLNELHNALGRVKSPTVSDEPLDPISLQDFRSMLAQCTPRTFTGERDRAILLMLLDTGIRHQEITDLLVSDISLDEGSVIVRRGKGNKGRTLFLGAKGRRAMASYLRWRKEPSSWSSSNTLPPLTGAKALWITDEGEPLTKSGIRQIIARRARAAGIKEPGMHMFRRAFCLNSLRNGMDIITLQRLMGHSSLAIINRYLKLVTSDLKESHSKYSVVDNL